MENRGSVVYQSRLMLGTDKSLLIVVPAYNEQDALGTTLQSIREVYTHVPVVVIDDGSTDATAQVAFDCGVEILRLPYHLGLGGAVQTGYRFAFEHGFERVVRVDADGQHLPVEIPKMLEKMSEGDYDMVTGSRFLEKNGYPSRFLRRVGGLFFAWMLRPILGLRLSDPTSGFIAVNRRTLEIFSHSYPLEYPEIEAIVVLMRKSLRFCEIAVKMQQRQAGRSTLGRWTSLRYMVQVFSGVFVNVIKYERRFHQWRWSRD